MGVALTSQFAEALRRPLWHHARMLLRSITVSAIILGSTLTSSVVLADVPGPKPQCDVEGLGCEVCWEHYGASEEDKATFESCAKPLRDKGFEEGCRHRQGAGDSVYFCPKGVKPEIQTVGGGCSGCQAAPAGGAFGAIASLALALGALRRRRSRAR